MSGAGLIPTDGPYLLPHAAGARRCGGGIINSRLDALRRQWSDQIFARLNELQVLPFACRALEPTLCASRRASLDHGGVGVLGCQRR
jgi:hypothetical protein